MNKHSMIIGLILGLVMSLPVIANTTVSGIYSNSCAICHGNDGKGDLPGTPDFTSKDGPLSKDDNTLHMNIVNGFQSLGSSMAMPPKGGNPKISDDDITALVVYMKQEFYVE